MTKLAHINEFRSLVPRYLNRLALAAFLILLLAMPSPILVDLGPQQHVQSINPKIGVHTRLTDEVEEWKIKRTLEMVREMGASWIVEFFPWAYYEPSRGHFDWRHADMVVDHANRQGLTVIARLGFVPQWARPKDTTFTYLDRDHYPDFARYVGEFVRHFKGRVHYVIIWNEPNLGAEWGYRSVDPAEYVEMLKMAYNAAKAADPNVKVLAGALAPTLAPPGSGWGWDDLDYLQKMYDYGAKGYFDILAAHAYGWHFPPDAPPSPDAINFSRVVLLRQIMVRNGDAGKSIIITEGGWNDHPRWSKAVRPAQRVRYTIRAYQKALEEWPWCRAVVFWAFRYPRPANTYQDYFTFVNVDFTPKPIYLAVQSYARGEEVP